jgi:hypothetical protein
MHYSRQNFAKRDEDGRPIGDVIEILDKDVSKAMLATGRDIGWNYLSPRDAVQLQLMYHCTLHEPFAGDITAHTASVYGPRSMRDLCDADCPCYEGQGMCVVLVTAQPMRASIFELISATAGLLAHALANGTSTRA